MSDSDLPFSNDRESQKITKTQESSSRNAVVDDDITVGCFPIKKTRPDENAPTVPPSPPKSVSIDQLAAAADNFYKMSLAHEITVNPDFNVERTEEPTGSLQHCIKESMHKAFWDLHRQKLESDPPDYSYALNLLKEIKQSLSGLILPHQHSLNSHIEQLDLTAAETQLAETGEINMAAYANQVIDLMSKWCAPVRDSDVANLRKISKPIDFFKQVFSILELMHMDVANFTIVTLRPFIKQQSAVYEREKFANFLEAQRNAGIDGLIMTRLWLQNAYKHLVDLNKATNSPPSPCYQSSDNSDKQSLSQDAPGLVTSQPPTPNNILREAFLSLLSIGENDFPETCVVDLLRVTEISDCIVKTVTLASLILTICNTVASNYTLLLSVGQTTLPPGALTKLKDVVKNDVRNLLDSAPATKMAGLVEVIITRILAIVDNWKNFDTIYKNAEEEPRNVALSSVQCALPEPLHGQLVNQIGTILKKEHPVYSLMFSRAIGFLRSALSARPPDQLTLPPGFSTLCADPPRVCERIASGGAMQRPPIDITNERKSEHSVNDPDQTYDLTIIASRLIPIVVHNRHVFGPYYAEIIQSIISTGLNTY